MEGLQMTITLLDQVILHSMNTEEKKAFAEEIMRQCAEGEIYDLTEVVSALYQVIESF